MVFFSKSFLRYGAPFLTLLVAGSFGLRQFTELRYTFKRSSQMSKEEAESLGVMSPKPVNLEEEYERLKEMNIDTWQNIRGPRPWEDSKEIQQQLREGKTQ